MKFETNFRYFQSETDKLLDLLSNISVLDPKFQKLIAEIIMVRLFLLVENSVKAICCKIVCGTQYLDATSPRLCHTERTISGAAGAMQTYLRNRPRQLKWGQANDIRRNVMYVVDGGDNLHAVLTRHGATLNEMRKVRNHIAHRNDTTRRNYRDVVKSYYGAYVSGVAPGTLLLSERRVVPPVLTRYIVASRVFIRELVKG